MTSEFEIAMENFNKYCCYVIFRERKSGYYGFSVAVVIKGTINVGGRNFILKIQYLIENISNR